MFRSRCRSSSSNVALALTCFDVHKLRFPDDRFPSSDRATSHSSSSSPPQPRLESLGSRLLIVDGCSATARSAGAVVGTMIQTTQVASLKAMREPQSLKAEAEDLDDSAGEESVADSDTNASASSTADDNYNTAIRDTIKVRA
eukprot:scaffold699_cov231-Pinguiococcus_pyrenoidosus.AAC.3